MGLSSKQVSGDHGLDWSQGLFNDEGSLEIATKPPSTRQQGRQTAQQQAPPPLRCPRCDSNNTKFCYYNNYSRSQPRHFCKACRRHWTNGGTLRNVPVGGGRKNKRPKTSHHQSSTTAATTAAVEDNNINSSLATMQHQHQLQFPMPFVPDMLCQALLHQPPPPQPPSSSPSDHYLGTNSTGGSNSSSLLGSLLSLPPMPPMPPFANTMMNSYIESNDPLFSGAAPSLSSSYSFFPFMRQEETTEEEKISPIPNPMVSTAPWQSLLPSCTLANVNVLEPPPSSAAAVSGYWSCWDDLTGLTPPPPPPPPQDLP